MATPQQIAEARAQAGFHGPATRQDILNAQKYGLGIFAATAKKIQSQGQGGAQGPAPTPDLSQQIATQQSSLGQLQANVPGYLDSQQSQILAQNPEYASIQSQRAQATGQLFSQPFEAAQQYSNVFNPMDRDKLISQAVGNVLQRLTGFNDILGNQRADAKGLAQQSLDRLNSQISLGKSNLDALQGQQTRADKLAAEQAQQDYQNRTLAATEKQRQFSNRLDLQKFALDVQKASKSAADSIDDTDLSGFVSIALDNAGNDAFDFNTFLSSVPSKLRPAFTREYTAGLDHLKSLTPEQAAAVTDNKPGEGIGSKIGNFFSGIKAPTVHVPRVPDISSMTPNQLLDAAKRAASKLKSSESVKRRKTGNVIYERAKSRLPGSL